LGICGGVLSALARRGGGLLVFVIEGVELTALDWVFLGGVFLAVWTGAVSRQGTLMVLVVLALSVGLSTSGSPAAGYLAMLMLLPVKLVQFLRTRG